MGNIQRDLRYALRVLNRRPGLSLAAVLCLALGIGATTVIYSLIDGVLLSPLPYEDPEGIYMVQFSFPVASVERAPASGKEFEDLEVLDDVFAEVGGVVGWNFNANSLDPPQRLRGGRLSAGAFRLLGVEPLMGRTFSDDEQKRGDRVVVLGHALWQSAFGGDRNILGKSVTLSQTPYEVIGVMPAAFRPFPATTEIWVPLVINPQVPRGVRGVQVLARLQADVDKTRADTYLDNLERRFVADYPEIYPETGWGLELDPLHEALVGKDVAKRLYAFGGAVFLVLLIACANVANLLFTQATGREKEMALRSAFGAGRGRLLRQLLTESALLALAGGVVGMVLATFGLRLVLSLDLGDIPQLSDVTIDGPVLLFSLLATLLTALAFGLVPALKLSGVSFTAALKDGGKTSAMGGRHPLRSGLVVAELALAGIVLIGAGLMIRSFSHLQQIDPGFRTADLVGMRIFLPNPAYATPEARVGFYERLRLRLAELPGVQDSAVTGVLPLSGYRNTGQAIGEGLEEQETWPEISWSMVSPGFFDLFEIPIVNGRGFTEADRADSNKVVVLDAGIAERLWPGQSPMGRRLKLPETFDDSWREVVGVVGRINQLDLLDVTEQVYLPFSQVPGRFVHPVVRVAGGSTATAAMVRDALKEIDPNLPVTDVTTLDQLSSASLAGPRFNLTLFSLFGSAALLLAAIGTYGVIAYSAAQRKVEIGVRRALGARRRDVLKSILGPGMTLAALGVLLGWLGAWGLSLLVARHLDKLVHGVPLYDVVSFLGVATLLLVMALLANLLPAFRAARLDPVRALRDE